MPAAQGTRRSAPAALGVSNPLEPGHDRPSRWQHSRPSTSRPSAGRNNGAIFVNLRARRQCFAKKRRFLRVDADACAIWLLYCFACFLTPSRAFDCASHTHTCYAAFLRSARVLCSTARVFHGAARPRVKCSLVQPPPLPPSRTLLFGLTPVSRALSPPAANTCRGCAHVLPHLCH